MRRHAEVEAMTRVKPALDPAIKAIAEALVPLVIRHIDTLTEEVVEAFPDGDQERARFIAKKLLQWFSDRVRQGPVVERVWRKYFRHELANIQLLFGLARLPGPRWR